MIVKMSAVFALALGLGACSPFAFFSSRNEISVVTPNQLYANPTRFEGREVTVRGYLAGVDCLYQSQERLGEAQGIVLLNAGRIAEDQERYVGKRLAIRGVFDADHLRASRGPVACGSAALVMADADVGDEERTTRSRFRR
jgi:hypothetical protein